MRKILVSLLLFAVTSSSFSQTHELGAQFNAGIAIYSFTKDPIVSERKSGKSGSGSLVEYGLEYTYTAKNNLFLKSGLGISNHFMSIKGGNSFRIFLGNEENWFLVNNNDSFNLLKTEHVLRTVTIPTSIGYAVPLGKGRRSTLDIGIELQHHFLAKSITKIMADTAFRTPNESDLDWIEKRFNDRANKYMLSFRPILDFNIFISDKMRLKISGIPVKKYLASWYDNINTSPFVIQFRIGLQCKL